MYLVVEFTGDKTVEVVPCAWVNATEDLCKWPPYRPLQITKACKEGEAPQSDWRDYPVRKLGGPYSTYEKARAKCRMAEDTSDIQSTDTDFPKRRKIQSRRYEIDSDSDEEVARGSKRTNNRGPVETERQTSFAQTTPPAVPPLPLPQSSFTTSPSCGNAAQLKILQRLLISVSQTVEEMNHRQKDMSNRLAVLEASSKAQSSSPAMPAEELPFPLTSMQELEELEEKLKEADFTKKVAARLATIGGRNSKDITRRIMERVFSKNLALQFNWLGRGPKRAFSGTGLYRTVMMAAKANNHVCVKEEETESAVKDWLRFAKDRQGGRKDRAEKNASQQQESGTAAGSS